MNTACKNFKDIRFFHEDGMKVYRRAVLSKRDVVTADDYVYLRQTTLPIANKIIAIIDLEVLSQDMWKKVKAGDFDGLAKVFNEEDKALEVIIDNESENLVDTDVPIEEPKNIDEEVVDTTTTPVLAVDAVKYEEQPTVAVKVDKELEDITQDTETIVKEENEAEESSDEEEEVVEVPVENINHQNNNNSFKKKRRH